MKPETVDAISAAGTKATLVGGGLMFTGNWIASNFLGIIGALIALAGLWASVHYKRKASKRADQLAMESRLRHENASALQARMAAEATKRMDAEHAQKIEMRRLQMELMRSGVLPRDFTPSGLAPLEWGPPVTEEEPEIPGDDDGG